MFVLQHKAQYLVSPHSRGSGLGAGPRVGTVSWKPDPGVGLGERKRDGIGEKAAWGEADHPRESSV